MAPEPIDTDITPERAGANAPRSFTLAFLGLDHRYRSTTVTVGPKEGVEALALLCIRISNTIGATRFFFPHATERTLQHLAAIFQKTYRPKLGPFELSNTAPDPASTPPPIVPRPPRIGLLVEKEGPDRTQETVCERLESGMAIVCDFGATKFRFRVMNERSTAEELVVPSPVAIRPMATGYPIIGTDERLELDLTQKEQKRLQALSPKLTSLDAQGANLYEDDLDSDDIAFVHRIQERKVRVALARLQTRYGQRLFGSALIMAGVIDETRGVIEESPTIQGDWRDYPVASNMEHWLRLPAIVGNDVDLAAVVLNGAELRTSAAADALPPGTVVRCYGGGSGIGGALVSKRDDGRFQRFRGTDGPGGEIGHSIIHRHNPIWSAGLEQFLAHGDPMRRRVHEFVRDIIEQKRCRGCGNRCFELLASGDALTHFARQFARQDENEALAARYERLAGGDMAQFDGKIVFDAAREGEPFSTAMIEYTAWIWAVDIVTAHNDSRHYLSSDRAVTTFFVTHTLYRNEAMRRALDTALRSYFSTDYSQRFTVLFYTADDAGYRGAIIELVHRIEAQLRQREDAGGRWAEQSEGE